MKKVYLHGWATDNNCFNALGTDYLKDSLMITLPGHSSEDRLIEADINIAVDKVKNSLAKLTCDIVLIGWSLGAKVLIKYLNEVKDNRVKGLVLIGASHRFTSSKEFCYGTSPAIVKTMIKNLGKDCETTLRRFYKLNFTEEELKSQEATEFLNYYENLKNSFDDTSLLNGLRVLLDIDLMEEIKRVQTPTLIISGEKDQVCPVEASIELNRFIKNSQIEIIENAGHAPFVTKPHEIKNLIDGFIFKVST